jgi:hypothetical protein
MAEALGSGAGVIAGVTGAGEHPARLTSRRKPAKRLKKGRFISSTLS